MGEVLAIGVVVAFLFALADRTRLQAVIGWIGASLWVSVFVVMALAASLLFALAMIAVVGTR